MRVVSGHQPAYLPWLGLLHKASLADVFVYMDDVQYLQGSWNNRNQIKTAQGAAGWMTVPVDLRSSRSRLLKDICIADGAGSARWQVEHWRTLKSSYGGSQFFSKYAPFFEDIYLGRPWKSLSELNLAILRQAFEWFDIGCEVVVASECNFTSKKSDLVLEHGQRYQADVVLTGTHGRDYIRVEDFEARGMRVFFQDYKHPIYEQRFGAFVPNLAFVDLLFNHGPASRSICLGMNMTRSDLGET